MIRTRIFVDFFLFASNLDVDVTRRHGRRFSSIFFDKQVVGQAEQRPTSVELLLRRRAFAADDEVGLVKVGRDGR
jgi:hypothetical protein